MCSGHTLSKIYLLYAIAYLYGISIPNSMSSNRRYYWPAISVLIGLSLVIVALPDGAKQWAPSFFRAPQLHFGLDLAGGTQLDFRISERELNEQIELVRAEMQVATGETKNELQIQLDALELQKENVTESIRIVLERRINSLGVSEARITPSEFGGEKHLLVECPGVVETQECIDTVGKTIQLEFKEEFTEATEQYEQTVDALASSTYGQIIANETTLSAAAEDLNSELSVSFRDTMALYEDQLPPGLEELWNMTSADAAIKVETVLTQPTITADGQVDVRQIPGVYIAELVTPRTNTGRVLTAPAEAMRALVEQTEGAVFKTETAVALPTLDPAIATATETVNEYISTVVNDQPVIVYASDRIEGQETMVARQILLSYSGAFRTIDGVVRTKEEAASLAAQARDRIIAGESFEAVAKEVSDGPVAENGGLQEAFSRDQKAAEYSEVAFALQAGAVSEVVETPVGYYLIQAVTAPVQAPTTVTFNQITLGVGADVNPVLTALKEQKVTIDSEQISVRYLFFSKIPTGWKDTELDGKQFRSATVALDEFGRPVVQINFDQEGAQLFEDLTRENIGKRIAIFVGGELVSAPTVQAQISGGTAVITGSTTFEEARLLAQDLNTGAIPAPIFLAGQRTVEATLGATALEQSLKAALIGVLILMVYMLLVYRLLGLLANIALAGYALIFFALLKLPLGLLSSQYIVLTLAGMAGIILSIGMAVDANVLIFERMKEELKKGKSLNTAAYTGFNRAWPSIRDGNVSTLITCLILFLIGTSIVRGFAITLGLGVLISMFSAIVLTRFLISALSKSPLADRNTLLATMRK